MQAFDSVMKTIDQAKAFGFRQLPSGTRLFGHVPHVAPEAWLHQVYAPLTETDCTKLEAQIGLHLPTPMREFYQLSNGLGLFSLSISIYGRRTSFARTGDDVWQPFCVMTANTLERPSHAKPYQFVIGGYQDDGSLLYCDSKNGSTFRCKGRSKRILNRWPDFWTMLESEAVRLSRIFDNEGRNLTNSPTTPKNDESGSHGK